LAKKRKLKKGEGRNQQFLHLLRLERREIDEKGGSRCRIAEKGRVNVAIGREKDISWG